jgi:hypothetical protein
MNSLFALFNISIMSKPTNSLSMLLRERMQEYTEIVKTLPLDDGKKKQINVNFLNFIRIIENLANKHLFLNDSTNITVIILSALVPILINFIPTNPDPTKINPSYLILATTLSVILAILNGIRQSYKFRERWQNYRETAEQLILEGQSYFAMSGKYAVFGTHELAFPKFIDAVNAMRTKQLNAYISQLMSTNDKEVAQSVEAEVSSRIAGINAAKEKVGQRILINDELNTFVKTEPKISYFLADHERKLVTIYANDNKYAGPEKFSFKKPGLEGIVYKVTTQFGDAQINGLITPSAGIKNQDMPSMVLGSVGCLCQRTDGTKVIVTCYHVVKHSSQKWELFIPGDHDRVIDSDGVFIGNIVEGEKDTEVDVALVEIDAGVQTDELLNGSLKIIDPIFIDEENFNDFSEVYLISRQRSFKKIRGKLSAVNKLVTMNYGTSLNRNDKNLDKLMIVTYVSTEPFSLRGDSGSLVFSSDGTAIGIVVGGDSIQASFVIPFTTIKDRYNLKLI